MATYKEIQKYVKEKYGFKPESCWIAHMKEVCNIPVRVASNRHSLDKREKLCPKDKQQAIKAAFKYLGVLHDENAK